MQLSLNGATRASYQMPFFAEKKDEHDSYTAENGSKKQTKKQKQYSKVGVDKCFTFLSRCSLSREQLLTYESNYSYNILKIHPQKHTSDTLHSF